MNSAKPNIPLTNISVVIPTYRNEEMLLRNLSHNQLYLSGHQIIVIDDDPYSKIDPDSIKKNGAMYSKNGRNLGFAASVHRAFQSAIHPYVLLLNSDVLLYDRSYERAITTLTQNPRVFGVSFAQQEQNGSITGKNTLFWKNGFFQHARASDLSSGINGWLEGGSALIDKSKYMKLGGFDPYFSPFYWEDIDLSYRAWKIGYEVLFDRNICVEHHHETTIGKYFSTEYIKRIAYRNQLYFIWKNISDQQLVIDHMLRLQIHLLKCITRDRLFLHGYLNALLLLPHALKMKNSVKYPHTDHEILTRFT